MQFATTLSMLEDLGENWWEVREEARGPSLIPLLSWFTSDLPAWFLKPRESNVQPVSLIFFCDCDGKFCSCLSCSWKTESKSVQYNFDEPRAAGKANLQQEKCWECGKWVYNGQDFFSKTGKRFRNPLTKGLVGLPSTNILDTNSSSKWFLKRIKESCRVPFTFMSLWAK